MVGIFYGVLSTMASNSMRQGTNAKGWPEKPWTIVSTPYGGPGGGIAHRYYALNLITMERGPLRDTMELAETDIKEKYVYKGEGPWAEPWGV